MPGYVGLAALRFRPAVAASHPLEKFDHYFTVNSYVVVKINSANCSPKLIYVVIAQL